MFRKRNRSIDETEDIEAKLQVGLHKWPSMSRAELDAFDSEIQRILATDLHEDSHSLQDVLEKLSGNQMKMIQLFKDEGQDQQESKSNLGKLRCFLRRLKLKFTRNWPQSNRVVNVSTLFGFQLIWNNALREDQYFRILNVMAMEAMPGSHFISSHETKVRLASDLRWFPVVPDKVDEAFGVLSWNAEASDQEGFSAKQGGGILNVEKGVLITVCSTGVEFQVTTFDQGSFSLAKQTTEEVCEKFKSAITKLGKIHEQTLQGFLIRVKLCEEAQQCISLKDLPEVTMKSALPHTAYSEVVEFSRVLLATDESQIETEKRLLLQKLSKFMTKEEQQHETHSM